MRKEEVLSRITEARRLVQEGADCFDAIDAACDSLTKFDK